MKRILIMGLPGAGKTTLAQALANKIDAMWFNADDVRKQYNDWDFSHDGRIRQSHRMRDLADDSHAKFVICDFVAPLNEMRTVYNADYTIWMDTIQQSRFADTDTMFVPPTSWEYNLRITNFDYNIDDIAKELL
jgi:adenylylsulfate kinase